MARSPVVKPSLESADDAVGRLRALVPASWRVDLEGDGGVFRVRVVGADGSEAELGLVLVDRLEPRDVDRIVAGTSPPGVVAAGWMSARTREVVLDRGFGYLDATGNVEVCIDRPALFIRTDGADRDPSPLPRGGPSLRGPKAWALLRTLAEVRPPYTVGELARAIDVDDGYVSRALRVLSDELLIEREPRGPVTKTEWEPLLRRIAQSYSLLGSNATSTWIAAAGPGQFIDDLHTAARPFAVTGSLVAAQIAPVAASQLAVVYTGDPGSLARQMRLLPATVGANVVLAVPYDPIVYRRGDSVGQLMIRGGEWRGRADAVSMAQAAIDCLTGPGRMPAEGEALLERMRADPGRWQSETLDG